MKKKVSEPVSSLMVLKQFLPRDPKTISIRARDGRLPFTEEEEKIVLEELRKQEPWPCFEKRSKRSTGIGSRISSKPGYHEAKRLKNMDIKKVKRENEPELSTSEFSNGDVDFLIEVLRLLEDN
eukprot:snap_masked-scaffold_19-processed-gene-1.47-mRNA-1 protein AED:1.00 eAED:1.00 QI:0/0/0/0/1/1/3/0/123